MRTKAQKLPSVIGITLSVHLSEADIAALSVEVGQGSIVLKKAVVATQGYQ
jgi:hypothetical protein